MRDVLFVLSVAVPFCSVLSVLSVLYVLFVLCVLSVLFVRSVSMELS